MTTRKFVGPEAFARSGSYHLLPFRFIALDDDREGSRKRGRRLRRLPQRDGDARRRA